MNRIKQLNCALAAALFAVAVSQPANSQTAQPEPGLVYVQPTDPQVEAAKREARSSLSVFFAHLASHGPDERDFAVKFNLSPDRNAEFIWAGELRTEKGGKLTGVLHNVPLDDRFKQGQRVAIDRGLIIDWGYRKGAVFQGHFTTRVLLERMPPDEAAQVRAELGW